MSKMIHLLSLAQEQRTANFREVSPVSESHYQHSDFRMEEIYKKTWLIVIVVFAIFLVLNLPFFMMTRNYTLRTNEAILKIDGITGSINQNVEQIASFTADLEKINSKLERINADIKELKQQGEGDTFAIETLTKSKNTLLNRLNTLELELADLKSRGRSLEP